MRNSTRHTSMCAGSFFGYTSLHSVNGPHAKVNTVGRKTPLLGSAAKRLQHGVKMMLHRACQQWTARPYAPVMETAGAHASASSRDVAPASLRADRIQGEAPRRHGDASPDTDPPPKRPTICPLACLFHAGGARSRRPAQRRARSRASRSPAQAFSSSCSVAAAPA